jgi:hypothetical protein
LTKTELPHNILSLKKSTENKRRILNVVREKKQTTYKGKPIKITADFSIETLKAKRAWTEVIQALNENSFNPKILYLEKSSFKIDRVIKVFHDKQKLKKYMATKPPLQNILQGILHTENEMAGSTKPQEKKRQESRE